MSHGTRRPLLKLKKKKEREKNGKKKERERKRKKRGRSHRVICRRKRSDRSMHAHTYLRVWRWEEAVRSRKAQINFGTRLSLNPDPTSLSTSPQSNQPVYLHSFSFLSLPLMFVIFFHYLRSPWPVDMNSQPPLDPKPSFWAKSSEVGDITSLLLHFAERPKITRGLTEH